MKREKSEYAIQAVENALEVLEQFKGSKGSLGITELSQRLSLHKNNIFRLLATMENMGYIEQDLNTEEYRLGIKSLELGRAFLNHTGLLKLAKPIMKELVKEIDENIYMGLLKNNDVVYVEHEESSRILRVASRIGTRLSPLCTAVGKIILAYSSETDREKIIKESKFEKHTENTIMDKDVLTKQMNEARQNGYVIDIEELDEGVICVASPILNYEKKVVAGLSISGPSLRMNDKNMNDLLIPKVKEYSMRLSKAIGYIE